ncbi:cysteine--tRNA ligase [Candidatus Microgenomates bacterium]|nr:cysteine--tRNA ligase [Candidatus Microgenomates bacterium]
MGLKLYNSLSKKTEEFTPIKKGKVGIYSCGPTVYWNQHIGHMYAYANWDVLVRFLRYSGFDVKWVMNITDVGHMTSDEDIGEDKMEKGAKREGVSVWDIAEKYIEQFKDSMKLLGISFPDVLCRATENIEEQIALNSLIEKNGYSYLTKKGLVFDTGKFADYAKFANLNLDEMKSRDDVEKYQDKKKAWDFFLWAINPKHAMLWESPWGEGYPGWHIECTAMSTKYLGKKFDIHTGGMEHIGVHHTNEIAQGFAVFGDMTANYWLHNSWLTSSGGTKMSKSLGNFVTAQELVEKGYDPLSMRYLILTSHYRKGLSFSWEALDSAQSGLFNLRSLLKSAKNQKSRNTLSDEKLKKVDEYRKRFVDSLNNDLNTPQALAVLWEVVKSSIPSVDKYELAMSFDEVLGLKLDQVGTTNKLSGKKQPTKNKDIEKLLKEREKLRESGDYKKADEIRDKLVILGYDIKDKPMK